MALKRKITKTEFEALPDALKAEYKASGDSYALDLDGGDELTRAKEAEAEKRRDAEKKMREAQAELDALKETTNKNNGDIEALEASWKKKLADAEKAAADANAALNTERQDRYVNSEAEKIAKRFTVPSLLKGEIAKRLTVEMHDGNPIVRVLDSAGKPSALTVAELEKEFVDNPEYKGIVIASKANGGAGDPASRPGGGAPTFPNNDGKPTDVSKLSAKDMVAHLKATDNEA